MKTMQFKQRGLSMTGWMSVALLVGFFMLCGFRMLPAYADNLYVVDALKDLTMEEKGVETLPTREIKKKLQSFFYVNNVSDEIAQNVKVERQKNKTLVSISYERRVDLFANIDVVMTFDNVLDSSRPGECCKPEKKK